MSLGLPCVVSPAGAVMRASVPAVAPVRHAFGAAVAFGLLWAGPAFACNPAPPLPPILEGYAYDPMAAEALVRDAGSVVTARLASVVELDLGAGRVEKTYVFEVIEGWKAVQPRRLAIEGVWVSCELPLERGRVFLMYLSGSRLLYALPGEEVDSELTLLGDVDWFYGPSGQRVEPVERD